MFFKTLTVGEVLSTDRTQHFPIFTNVLYVLGISLLVYLTNVTIQLILQRERLRTLWAFHPGIPLGRFDHFLRWLFIILVFISWSFFLLLVAAFLK